MNGVLIVPTGLGAKIGGHAGDANGRPHKAAEALGIPVIMVKENKTVVFEKVTRPTAWIAANYWEAAGLIMSIKAGIDRRSVRRPLKHLALKELIDAQS